MLCPPHPWERTASAPAQVTFAFSIKGGHWASTVILSGLLAINVPFVVCSFCPPSSQTPAEVARSLMEVRCLVSASAQPHLLKAFVLFDVLGWLLGAPELWQSWCWSTDGLDDCKNKHCRDKCDVPWHESPSGPPSIFGLQDATLPWQESF